MIFICYGEDIFRHRHVPCEDDSGRLLITEGLIGYKALLLWQTREVEELCPANQLNTFEGIVLHEAS